jgi:hypothetical protein
MIVTGLGRFDGTSGTRPEEGRAHRGLSFATLVVKVSTRDRGSGFETVAA